MPPGLELRSNPGVMARFQCSRQWVAVMLKDLAISGFRGFESLKIDHLGGVNLILGKNGVGKTSLLEAIWLYSSPMNRSLITELLITRQEYQYLESETWDIDLLPLFNGGRTPRLLPLVAKIGPASGPISQTLRYRLGEMLLRAPADPSEPRTIVEIDGSVDADEELLSTGEVAIGLAVDFGGLKSYWPRSQWSRRYYSRERYTDPANPFIRFSRDNSILIADWWRSLALTDAEGRIASLMSLVCKIDRISYVGVESSTASSRQGTRDRFLVRQSGSAAPQPLKSLGDGVERVFQTAMALEFARFQSSLATPAAAAKPSTTPFAPGWCVLVDEIDSGVHYSVLEQYWDAIFRISSELGVQVFATTHSRECINAFQKAALRSTDVEGVAIRLERVRSGIHAVTIAEDDLTTVVESGIEIR
jgi:hypothetical protein